MAYATSAQVGAKTPKWSRNGDFNNATSPTKTQVDAFLDEVSGLVDTIVKNYGMTTPVTETPLLTSLQLFVSGEVASIVEGLHGGGRFGPTQSGSTEVDRFTPMLLGDVKAFLAEVITKEEGVQMGSATLSHNDAFTQAYNA